jgi:hypothetical protein
MNQLLIFDFSHSEVETFAQLLAEEYGIPDNIDDFTSILDDILDY